MDILSADLPQFLRLIIALGVVLALMGGLSFLIKKLGLAAYSPTKSSAEKRLKVVESLPLDARRRLMIVRCDDREHLVILGGNSETVIANDIRIVDDSAQRQNSP